MTDLKETRVVLFFSLKEDEDIIKMGTPNFIQ
jgi:hypothetical protein